VLAPDVSLAAAAVFIAVQHVRNNSVNRVGSWPISRRLMELQLP
jgi:hypothetical protein